MYKQTGVRRLLFTDDDWSIYKAEYLYAGNYGRVLAYAHHHQGCKVSNKIGRANEPMNCWHTGDLSQKCVLCSEPVPEGIQALVVLYQWE